MNYDEIGKKYHLLTALQKAEFLSNLSTDAFNQFYYYSDAPAREKQKIIEGNWRYYIVQAGRGFGKSWLGSRWIASKVHQKKSGLAIVAPTHHDIQDYIIEAFEQAFPPTQKPKFVGGDKKYFICYNNIKVKVYSAEVEVRGPNLSHIWIDEFFKWCDGNEVKATERFNILDKSVRKGGAQMLITSTPKPWKILSNWNKDFSNKKSNIHMVYGETNENTILPKDVVQDWYDKLNNTREGRQELLGQLLEDIEGALFNQNNIDDNRISEEDFKALLDSRNPNKITILRIVVADDPAMTNNKTSDETGIIVAALGKWKNQYHAFILDDKSGVYTPLGWAKATINAYHVHKADLIIAEKNQGGALVESNIRSAMTNAPIKLIHASKGKMTRAEPVGTLYERALVHHIGNYPELEQQMTHYTGDPSQESPDRLDALVYAITELLLEPNTIKRDFSQLGFY